MKLTYDQLVMDVYEAADNPDYFSEVGNRICAFAGGQRAHFMLVDPENADPYLSCLSGEQDDFSREYDEIYLARDFRVPRVLALPVAHFTDERAYVAAEEARKSEIHQDLLARYGVHNIYGANLRTGSAMGWFGLSVGESNGDFDPAILGALSGLTLHLQRAYATLKSNSDLRLDRRLMAATLDESRSAVLIVDRGRVVLANARLHALLSQGFFRLRGARLECRDRDESRRLAVLQGGGTGLDRASLVIRDARGGDSFVVARRPLFPQIAAGRLAVGGHWILTVTSIVEDEEPDHALIEAFCREHGLTAREGEAVAAILTDTPLSAVARRRGVTIDTTRKQLKSAMERLDVASQKAIIRLFERFRLAV